MYILWRNFDCLLEVFTMWLVERGMIVLDLYRREFCGGVANYSVFLRITYQRDI